MTFKRTQTRIASGDYRAKNALRSADHLPAQPVEIVKSLPDTDDSDDLYLIRTYSGYQYEVDGSDLSPHPTEPELNTEFVERLMTMDSPLMQPFILQAIEQFAKAVLTAPAKKPEDDTGMVSDAAWRHCAQFTLGNILARDIERKERDARFAARFAA